MFYIRREASRIQAGSQEDDTMLLDLVGGGMKPAPSWALSVAELEQLGLDERSARFAAGVSPGFDLDGRWVVLVDDQPYDPARASVIEISGDEAVYSDGRCAKVERWRRFALLTFLTSHPSWSGERIVLSGAPTADSLYGMSYSGTNLPPGDPGELWDGEDAEDLPENLPLVEALWLYREETLRGDVPPPSIEPVPARFAGRANGTMGR